MSKEYTEWYRDTPVLRMAELKPFRVEWNCPTCKFGSMISTGEAWPVASEMGYHHECNNCGERLAVRGKTYPTIEYREVYD